MSYLILCYSDGSRWEGLALAKAKILDRVSLNISTCFMIALWADLDLLELNCSLQAPSSKCLLTIARWKKHWPKSVKLLSSYNSFWLWNILKTPGNTVCSKKQTGPTQRKEIRLKNWTGYFIIRFRGLSFYDVDYGINKQIWCRNTERGREKEKKRRVGQWDWKMEHERANRKKPTGGPRM
jgi:hypothetical protein